MFLPVTKKEMKELGWNKLDIILVSGDTYIDSPYIGISILGKLLVDKGFRVGVIAQPDIKNGNDIMRLGEPELFWGVTAGSVDSMVANYTASKKRRKHDDYTPGEINNRRPDRAVIAYTNLIRRHFKNTVPIIIGGIEASLRRIAHYDFWSNKIRRSILFDSKADYLVYGMGEKTLLEIAIKLKKDKSLLNIRGMSYISNQNKYEYIQLPSFEKVVSDKYKFIEMFNTFYLNNDPLTAKGLVQKHGERFLIQNPPQFNPTTEEMDYFYGLEYERDVHPYYAKFGKVKALDTIRFSITTHRGCYGECNFCAIAVHQGQTISNRSRDSIINEAVTFTKDKNFKGIISDVGGPTANMYGFECAKKLKAGTCNDKRCVAPATCPALRPTHKPQIDLLRKLRKINGIKKIFVASGIRFDMVLDDKHYGEEYLKEIVQHHTSGQMKIAPEHSEDKVLNLMGKPGKRYLREFREKFFKYSREAGKNQFLTYYLIAAHPGCTEADMKRLKQFSSEKLSAAPEQVQIFTPTPSTYSTLMYYTEVDPFTGKRLFVEKDINKMIAQKNIVVPKKKREAPDKRFSTRQRSRKHR